MQNRTSAEILVVMGDVHANLPLALRGLERIEEEYARSIAQVFSVGDLGLFLDPLDWNFLSGPKKHRHPERTPAIVSFTKRRRDDSHCSFVNETAGVGLVLELFPQIIHGDAVTQLIEPGLSDKREK